MKISIEIETGNDAMQTWADIHDAITRTINRRIIETRKDQEYPKPSAELILDTNGNTIGLLKVTK